MAQLLYTGPAGCFCRFSDVRRMKRIVSAENPRFKSLLKLAESSRERKKHGLSLLDGAHLVAAYREHVELPVEVFISKSGAANPEVQAILTAVEPLTPL